VELLGEKNTGKVYTMFSLAWVDRPWHQLLLCLCCQ